MPGTQDGAASAGLGRGRRTGVGSLAQVLRDLDELAALGAEHVVLDTYRVRPEDYRPAEEDWRMLETVAARSLQRS